MLCARTGRHMMRHRCTEGRTQDIRQLAMLLEESRKERPVCFKAKPNATIRFLTSQGWHSVCVRDVLQTTHTNMLNETDLALNVQTAHPTQCIPIVGLLLKKKDSLHIVGGPFRPNVVSVDPWNGSHPERVGNPALHASTNTTTDIMYMDNCAGGTWRIYKELCSTSTNVCRSQTNLYLFPYFQSQTSLTQVTKTCRSSVYVGPFARFKSSYSL